VSGRWLPLLLVVTATGSASLGAQSSQFGVRGFGLPMRPISVRASGTGGGFSLFDSESAVNPASVAQVGRLTAGFQTVQVWSRSESPLGTATIRANRYPGVIVTGPIGGTPLSLAISVSGYTDRNFSLASRDTIELREVPVEVLDTITSLGGISDFRLAIAYRKSPRLQAGLGFHLLTGSNRITSHRVFTDTLYAGASERSTISYQALGISAGVTGRPIRFLTLAGTLRADGRLKVERDTSRVTSTRLPVTVAAGARVELSSRLHFAGGAQFRNWSVADSGLVDLGGVGSVNTTEWSAGLEFLPNPSRPARRPMRIGFYRAGVPFEVLRGTRITETGISAGSSLEFGGGRVRMDFSLSRVWRDGGPDYSERATMLQLGVSIAPPGLR